MTAIERLRAGKPDARPAMAEVFKASGAAAAQIAILPTDDNRRVISEMMPTLSKEMGGGATTALTRGLLWAAIAIDVPPKPALRVRIECPDPDAAQELHKLIERSLAAMVSLVKPPEGLDLKVFAAALLPAVEGQSLVLNLQGQQYDDVIVRGFAPSLLRARELARRTASNMNIKSMMAAVYACGADHKDAWPENLQVLVKAGMISPKQLVNPRDPSREVGYVYIRPPESMAKTPPDRLVIYEAFDRWEEGVGVGLADGHAEFIASRARFEKLLNAAQTRPSTKPKPE